jgi:hypothetical protein
VTGRQSVLRKPSGGTYASVSIEASTFVDDLSVGSSMAYSVKQFFQESVKFLA